MLSEAKKLQGSTANKEWVMAKKKGKTKINIANTQKEMISTLLVILLYSVRPTLGWYKPKK